MSQIRPSPGMISLLRYAPSMSELFGLKTIQFAKLLERPHGVWGSQNWNNNIKKVLDHLTKIKIKLSKYIQFLS